MTLAVMRPTQAQGQRQQEPAPRHWLHNHRVSQLKKLSVASVVLPASLRTGSGGAALHAGPVQRVAFAAMPLTRIPVHPVFRQDTQANVDAAKLGAWNTTSLRGALEVATVDRAVRGDGPATGIPPAAADFHRQRRQDGDRCDDRVVDPSDEGNIHLHSSTFDAYTGTITITWLGSPRPEVFALLRGAEDETRNLYFSKQYGQR